MKLTKIQLLGLVRHTLTFVGGIFVAYGTLTSEELVSLIGSASTLTGVIWSIINKRPLDEVITAALTEKKAVVKEPKIVAKPKLTKSEFPVIEDKPKPKKRYYKKKKPVQ
jgi:hypothetical protein